MPRKKVNRVKPDADPPPPPPRPVAPRRLPWSPLLRLTLGFGLAAAAIIGLIVTGDWAGRAISESDRYTVRFDSLDCPSPPGISRDRFLAEVRYLSRSPETIQSTDPKLAATLSEAFLTHPWVRAIDKVEATEAGQVRVELRFREPVLVVRVVGDPEPRLVDATGVLLPSLAPPANLAELIPVLQPPTKPAGQTWPDPDVIRAAELAVEFQPRKIEKTTDGWRITRHDGSQLQVGR